MDLEEYKKAYVEGEDAPGWDAIDAALKRRYPEQKEQHFAPKVPAMLGGDDPLDGISMYVNEVNGVEHLHFVTFGFSRLFYDESDIEGFHSGFGFELTFRLKRFPGDEETPIWVCNMLQNIARYVFTSGKWFEEFQFMDAKGPIRMDTESEITALTFVKDPELKPIDTPHGRVEFLQLFGLTSKELERLKDTSATSETLLHFHAKRNPLWVTDLERKDLLS